MHTQTDSKRFRIAFYFAGDKREFVSKVADILAKKFGSDRNILYDKYHEAEFARSDLGIYLPELYHKECDLVVVVLCKNYREKEWTGLEWTAIHDLLKKRKVEEVLLTRFDRAEILGLYTTAGFIELDQKSPEDTAKLILERLALNEGKPKEFYSGEPASSDTNQTVPYRSAIKDNQFDPIHENNGEIMGIKKIINEVIPSFKESDVVFSLELNGEIEYGFLSGVASSGLSGFTTTYSTNNPLSLLGENNELRRIKVEMIDSIHVYSKEKALDFCIVECGPKKIQGVLYNKPVYLNTVLEKIDISQPRNGAEFHLRRVLP